MNERIKNLARLGVAAGLAVGGAIQTAEVLHQRDIVHGIQATMSDQEKTIEKQRLDIMDLKNNECWDWNFIQKLVETVAGVPGPGFVDCDTVVPLGHPQATPTVSSKGG